MELSDLVALLPPGLLGIGGVVPLLIGQNPISDEVKAKPLLATVAVLMVWLVWLCCLMLFRVFLFSQYWAILWLLIGIVCLGFLVREMLIPRKMPDDLPNEEIESIAVKYRNRITLLYSGGLLSTAIAASIMVAMKDWVIVDVKFKNATPGRFEKVSLQSYKSGLDLPFQDPTYRKFYFRNGIRVAIAQKSFDSAEWDTLSIQASPVEDGGDKRIFYLERKGMTQIIMPGAGTLLEGNPTTTKPVHTQTDSTSEDSEETE